MRGVSITDYAVLIQYLKLRIVCTVCRLSQASGRARAEVEAEQGCGSSGCELADCKEKDEGKHVHGRRREEVLRDWVLCKDRDNRKRCL